MMKRAERGEEEEEDGDGMATVAQLISAPRAQPHCCEGGGDCVPGSATPGSGGRNGSGHLPGTPGGCPGPSHFADPLRSSPLLFSDLLWLPPQTVRMLHL